MFFVAAAIIILVVSFVIALISLISEQRNAERSFLLQEESKMSVEQPAAASLADVQEEGAPQQDVSGDGDGFFWEEQPATASGQDSRLGESNLPATFDRGEERVDQGDPKISSRFSGEISVRDLVSKNKETFSSN